MVGNQSLRNLSALKLHFLQVEHLGWRKILQKSLPTRIFEIGTTYRVVMSPSWISSPSSPSPAPSSEWMSEHWLLFACICFRIISKRSFSVFATSTRKRSKAFATWSSSDSKTWQSAKRTGRRWWRYVKIDKLRIALVITLLQNWGRTQGARCVFYLARSCVTGGNLLFL